MACANCNDLEVHSQSLNDLTISELELSAKTCKFCQIVLSIVKETDPTRVEYISITSDTRDERLQGINLHVSILPGYTKATGYEQYTIRNLSGSSKDDVLRACEPGCVNTGSAAGVRWAEDKIRECQNSHSNCNLKTRGYLPDRVLSIGPLVAQHTINGEDGFESDVKLYESSSETSAYATLSHRWGTSQPLSLRLDNILDFRRSIPWQSLPKTFQQAIMFARKLGIEYIWIDSLCIIQDSKEDWLEQAGKMANIYEHSVVTLAATASDGAVSGCFVEPSMSLQGYVTDGTTKLFANDHMKVRSLLSNTDTDEPVVYVKESPSHNSPGYFTYNDLPLLKRGWVYQERLLSPRILHFGAIDLIWECNYNIACYCKFYTPSYNRNPIGHPIKPQHAACVRADAEAGTLAARWVHLIQQYTALDLTYDSDRLQAIAGVAKQFRRAMKNKNYMAGLWEESLPTGLTWSRATLKTVAYHWQYRVLPLKPRPCTAETAPSWSWMSVPGAITYPSSRYVGVQPQGGPKVTKVVFDHDGVSEFTTLRSGSIALHGKLMVVKQRLIQTTEGARYGIINPGLLGFFEVSRDFSPDDDQIINEWHTVYPRWAQKSPSECQDNLPPQVHQLPANEDLDDEIPMHLSEEQYISTQQCSGDFYGLYMGMRMDDGARTAMFMLLDRSDGPEQVHTRLGLGAYSPDLSLFEGVEETQDVVLV